MTSLPISNFRDVKGYVNADGWRMKPNCIFRGASLDRLTKEEALYMEKELGIRYILDYRDEQEAALKPDIRSNGMRYERISALQLAGEKRGFDFGSMLSQPLNAEHLAFLIDYLKAGYRQMPFANPAYQRLFEILLAADGHVYFHCSAGKDRTGVGAFLIMMALGMSEQDAIDEYLLSNIHLTAFVEAFCQQYPILQEHREAADALLLVNREYIALTISAIKQRYPSYDAFLEREYGLDRNKRTHLIQTYCEKIG